MCVPNFMSVPFAGCNHFSSELMSSPLLKVSQVFKELNSAKTNAFVS